MLEILMSSITTSTSTLCGLMKITLYCQYLSLLNVRTALPQILWHILMYCPTFPHLLSPLPSTRAASSTWLDTSSQFSAQPLLSIGASRSRGSFMPKRTRKTSATAVCFVASKRAWKANTHPPTDAAEMRWSQYILPLFVMKLVLCHKDRRPVLASSQAPPTQNVLFFKISCDDGRVDVNIILLGPLRNSPLGFLHASR